MDLGDCVVDVLLLSRMISYDILYACSNRATVQVKHGDDVREGVCVVSCVGTQASRVACASSRVTVGTSLLVTMSIG